MASQNLISIEKLNRSNYSTWSVLMKALLVKNDYWDHVSGTTPASSDERDKPAWKILDEKAKAELFLNISTQLLTEVKDVATSNGVWKRLKEICDSSTPARKATLFKKLILEKATCNNILDHITNFFDITEKLKSIEVTIDNDLLCILLLYSLPAEYENFRIAIETRDNLPKLDTLKIKIIEEFNARSTQQTSSSSSALLVKNEAERKNHRYRHHRSKKENRKNKPVCFSCRKPGHIAAECKKRRENSAIVQGAESLFAVTKETVSRKRKWILDSGATSHMTYCIDKFVEYHATEGGELNLATYGTTAVKGYGKVKIKNEYGNITLENVLYVPNLRLNLLSIGKIAAHGFKIQFINNYATVFNNRGKCVLKAKKSNELYETNELMNEEANTVLCENDLKLWHQRYGHINFKTLKEMIKNEVVKGINLKDQALPDPVCEVCLQAKQTRTPFPKGPRKRCDSVLEVIHSDIVGPISTKSAGGASYFITFIDDHSKWTEVYFLKQKNGALDAFKMDKAKVENFSGQKIKALRTDNGKEYVNHQFSSFLKTYGIQHQLAVEYTPQQNGLAERQNRTLIEMARSILIQSGFQARFWAEAINTANYIRNRSASSSLNGETPYKLWHKKNPYVGHLRTFGTPAYVLIKSPGRKKFEPKSKLLYLIGYCEDSKAYKLYDKEQDKIVKSRDVKFLDETKSDKNENELNQGNSINNTNIFLDIPSSHETTDVEMPAKVESEDAEIKTQEVQENTATSEDTIKTAPFPSGRGRPRILRTGSKGRPRKITQAEIQKLAAEKENKTNVSSSEYNTASNSEDEVDEAFFGFLIGNQEIEKLEVQQNEKEQWNLAIKDELDAHHRNGTWSIVDKPEGVKVIGSKWIFNTKYNTEGRIAKRKARLVAKGCSQRYGLDYYETYSPVARQRSIRLVTALAVKYDLSLHQFDIVTAYLNGNLENDIYMTVPEYLEDYYGQSLQNKVCKLNKAIYGLKQSGRIWYEKLDKFLKEIGFKNLKHEPCMYLLNQNDNMMIVTIYVDDILVAAKDEENIEWFRTEVTKRFEVKDIGKVRDFLGIEFNKLQNGDMVLIQSKFIQKMLEKFNMQNCNPVSTPLPSNTRLSKDMCPHSDAEKSELADIPYQSLIGSLLYLAVTTRPNIAYATSVLSQYNSNFGKAHWQAAKRVLRYLKGTMNFGLIFSKSDEDLVGYTDADWANNVDDRRSYTGYFFMYSNAPISWEVRKQRTVALSSSEAEYMAIAEAAKEALYLKSLFVELGIRSDDPVNIYNDNINAQLIAENHVINSRSKHIDVRFHFIRDAIKSGDIKLLYMNTLQMPADALTKALPISKLTSCLKKLSLKPVNTN